jgi:hypothetical protein
VPFTTVCHCACDGVGRCSSFGDWSGFFIVFLVGRVFAEVVLGARAQVPGVERHRAVLPSSRQPPPVQVVEVLAWLAVLRNAAYQLGANFVRIDSIEQPHMDPNPRASCFHNEFTLLGVAFKLPGSAAVQIAPSPAPVRPRAEPAIAAPAPAPRSENNSCHNTESCYRLGQCSSVNGACVVLVDDDCKGSMECTKGHRCSASAGHCVAKPRSAGVAEP